MKSFFVTYWVFFAAAIVALAAGGGYWYVRANLAPSFNAVTVQRGNVIASLDEPGIVRTENSADLSFQTTGQVTELNVREGDTVSVGTLLASLDASGLRAALDQANAGVAAAQAKLDELKSGTRPEQLAVYRTAVANASASLGVAIGSAYAAADDAVHNQTDIFFSDPQSSTFIIPSIDSQTVREAENKRSTVNGSLAAWYAAMNASSSNQESLGTIAASTLQQTASYLNTVSIAVGGVVTGSNISSATLAGYKASIAAARAEVNASISALTGAEAARTTASDQLALAEAGATAEDIEAQKAAVAQAQAAASSALVSLRHAELIAPFSGTVENLTAKIGQVVSSGAPILSLINNAGLKIRAYVSEVDMAKIKTGDAANVTLDAFGGGTVFPATITAIASVETQVNGSSAYEVTFHFTHPDSRVKDGMTGNVHIIIGEHDNVVEVPTRLIIRDGDNDFVLVRHGGKSLKQQVEAGLSGDDGMTEIVSGVNVGDTITDF